MTRKEPAKNAGSFVPIGNAPWYALSLGITLAKNFSYLISFTV